jgi:hypothetical protein
MSEIPMAFAALAIVVSLGYLVEGRKRVDPKIADVANRIFFGILVLSLIVLTLSLLVIVAPSP